MAATSVVLNVENLTKRFGDMVAVEHINFDIKDGEFATLVGPTGCGKTTTLRMIAGFETVTEGSIQLDGKSITELPPQDRPVSMVFQNLALFPQKTVGENIEFGLKMQGVPKAERKRKAIEIMGWLGVPSAFYDRDPRTLSGGEAQRTALARALLKGGRVMLFDEALQHVDAKLRRSLQKDLKRLNKETKQTFIFVTHDLQEALVMSDKLIVMNEGKIEQIDSPANVYDRPRTKFVADFIGETNLLPCCVVSCDENRITVKATDLDREFVLPNDVQGDVPKEGHLLIRAERIKISKRPTQVNYVIGELNERFLVGPIVHYGAKVGERTFTVASSNVKGERYDGPLNEKVVLEWGEEAGTFVR